MIKYLLSIKKYLFPNKKINYLVIFIFTIGVIFGTIFLCRINSQDSTYVITKINTFISSLSNNNLNYKELYTNSIIINLLYLFLIFIFGFTIIGLFLVIILIFLKGFVFGFYIGSFVLTYNYKGIILSCFYTLFSQGINIISIIIMSIISIMFSFNLLSTIFNKKDINYKKKFRNYFIIFLILFILSFISSLLEVFVFPAIIRLIINIFV